MTTDTQTDQELQRDVGAPTDIIDAVDIAGRLPAIEWPLGLLYLGISLHGHKDATGRRLSDMVVGRSQDLRLKSDSLVGGALIAEGALVHLGAWSAAYH